MTPRSELVERLRKATGPDRELDRQICLLVGDNMDDDDHCGPHYTASFDAAMTLVPESWTWDADCTAPSLGCDFRLHDPNSSREVLGSHENSILALCIAALQAQE